MSGTPGSDVTRWLLTADERDNPHTTIDDHHPGEQAWSTGNHVRPLVDGATYFAEPVRHHRGDAPGRPRPLRGVARRR